MVDQSREKPAGTNTIHSKDVQDQEEISPNVFTVPEPSRHDVVVYTSSPMVSLASETLLGRIPSAVEKTTTISDNFSDDTNAQEPALVDKSGEPLQISSFGFPLMDHNYIRCERTGVGCPLRRSQDTGKMVLSHQRHSI